MTSKNPLIRIATIALLAVIALAVSWVWRSFQVEDAFVEQTVQRAATQPVKLGEHAAADRVRRGLVATIVADGVRTRDLGGRASTAEFGRAVAARVA